MIGIKGRRFIATGGGESNPDPTGIMKFVVTFSGVPSSMPTITSPPMKYGKKSFLTLNWDDGSPGSLVALERFKQLTYTDGCGNNINYTGAVAFNSGFGIPSDPGYNPDYFQPTAMRGLVNNNWDLENHSYYHGANGTADPSIDTNLLDALMLLRVNYQPRGMVIPTNYNGYAHASYLLDYIYATSQGDAPFDEFKATRVFKTLQPYTKTPYFMAMVREFYDEWDSAKSDGMWQIFNDEITDLTNGNRDYLILGTHSALETTEKENGFIGLMQQLHDQVNDHTMVCSTREALEYREMTRMPVMKSLSGSRLEVTIDLSALSTKNRWRDWCGVINSDVSIENVEIIEGITNTSFNPSTKLVNIFQQKKIW